MTNVTGNRGAVATVRVTTDKEKFMSCENPPTELGLAAWERTKGNPICIQLPARKRALAACQGWQWLVVPEETKRIRPDLPERVSWICEHSVDCD